MKQFGIFLLFAVFALIFISNAQHSLSEISKRQISQIPPIIINSIVLCLQNPLPARCNPCKYGQPITTMPCGQGQEKCAASGGICKVNQYDKAYCCPNEHPGCCPATSPVITPLSPINLSICIPTCKTDDQCKDYQKCCGSCPRCVNATLA
jgi:hypothetical protein